eukprot:scaffold44825_cov67-Phaeocystis_antarctica.AAC.2
MLFLTWLSCSLLLHPSVRRSTRPRMQAEAAAEVVGVTFEEEYSDRLPEWLIARAAELGYTNPTPVQQETLDTVLDGHDAIVQAKTGSGKTLAYLLPILANLKPTSSVQALVLLPTRELATQVARAARQLAAGSPDRLLVMALMDGSGAKRQRKWLVAEPPQVVVANVQQAESVLRSGLLKMGGLRMLVVDEVDECVSTDATRAMLHGLLSTQLRVPQSTAAGAPVRQTLFVSATVPRLPSGRLACTRPPARHSPHPPPEPCRRRRAAQVPQRKYFASQCVSRGWCRTAPRLLHVQPTQLLPPQLRHAYAVCAEAKRMAALRVLLKAQPASAGATIVFCKEGRPMERMAEALATLQESGLPPDVLSDGQHLGTRAAAVRALRDGSRTLLLSTYGMSARGLDIPQCSHVILFDLPKTHEAYTHAAGRCGRMGRPGSVTTICTDKELFVLQRIANSLNLDFEDARRSMKSSTTRRPRRDKASSSESSESSESS